MSAARSGRAPVVALLLDNGADPNVIEKERQQTALMWAAAQGHAEVARLLLEAGADLQTRSVVWYQLENTRKRVLELLPVVLLPRRDLSMPTNEQNRLALLSCRIKI